MIRILKLFYEILYVLVSRGFTGLDRLLYTDLII